MKKALFLAMALLIACSASFAQDAKEILKERKIVQKMAKLALAVQAVRGELEKKGDKLHEQLDKALGF